MARKSPRSGLSGRWPLPITGATPTMAAIAARILKDAPPRLRARRPVMGGYIAFAMLRLAPERVAKLALLDTSARPDTPEQTAGRKTQIAMAQSGRYGEIPDLSIPRYLNAKHQRDERLAGIVGQMIAETGPEAFVRQLNANHVTAGFAALAGLRSAARLSCWSATPTSRRRRNSNKEIADGIPGANLTVVPDSGHLTTIEQPEAVNAALAEWLSP